MKKNTSLFLIAFLLFVFHQSTGQSNRIRKEINQNWLFEKETTKANQHETNYSDSQWKKVNVPHIFDWVSMDIDGSADDKFQKTFQRNVGWYRKKLLINATSDQNVYLEFEGAHQVTELWVNGKYVGKNEVSGYTPFHFEISNFIIPNKENSIALRVDNSLNDNIPLGSNQADFIRYNGLYRDLYLVTTHKVHVDFAWASADAGINITTPSVSAQNATVSIKTAVKNETKNEVQVEVIQRILDKNKHVVAKLNSTKNIVANGNGFFRQSTTISENLHLWSIEDPYLYSVLTEVYVSGKLVDHQVNPLGIRKIEFIENQGFLLNGKNVELVGVNRHQQYPFVGNAASNSLHRADALQFKKMGFNVVRLAHYPHDDSFIEACDELGILLYEEAPTWINIGNKTWMDNLLESTRIMIRNHRNHPSIIMWSGGINHRGPVPAIHNACKEEDPSRPTASNGSPWTGPRNSGSSDLYTPMDYQGIPLPEGELMFFCEHGSSENAHINQLEVSKSRQAANRIGVAMWTAHEYLAFKRNDLLNLRRPFSIFRQEYPLAFWYQSELTEKPMVYIADERLSKNGKVTVFSNCSEVSLFANGKLVATQNPDFSPEKAFLKHPSFTFDFDWKDEKLVAEGINFNIKAAEASAQKAGKAVALKLRKQELAQALTANGSDMLFVYADVVDQNGNIVYNVEKNVSFEILGDALLQGDLVSGANPIKTSFGTASAIIRTGSTVGTVKIIAKSAGLESSEISLEIASEKVDKYPAYVEEAFHNLDFGNAVNHLVQFDWEDVQTESFALSKFGKATLKIKNYEQFEDNYGATGDYAYIVNDGILSKDGKIELSIENLPSGNYEITFIQNPKAEKEDFAQNVTIMISGNEKAINVQLKQKNREAPPMTIDPVFVKAKVKLSSNQEIKILLETKETNKKIILNGLKIRQVLD